jgi:hypothetical protein
VFRRDRQRLRSVRTTQSGIPHKASKTRRAEHRSLRSSETQEQESRVLRQSSVASKVVAEERKTGRQAVAWWRTREHRASSFILQSGTQATPSRDSPLEAV